MAYPAKRVTLWFQDEARFGQKGRLCHRWWLKGQRPPGLCDHRFDWTYIFAAAQPATGDAFALVLPEVSTEAMDLFMAEFSKTLPPDEHALMVVDGAGWHTSKTLAALFSGIKAACWRRRLLENDDGVVARAMRSGSSVQLPGRK
jgi:hypothetical protein